MSAIHKFIENKQENLYFKKNQFLFDSIINAFLTSKSVISAKNKILADVELMRFINAEIPQVAEFDIYTKLNWILTGRQDFPRCHYCNEILPKLKIPVFREYSQWCCAKHMCNDPLYKKILQDAFEKKYGPGVRSNFQIPGAKDKIKAAWREKYGTDNPFALESIKRKKRNTFIEHYGIDNNMKSEKGLQSYRQAMQKKYGVDYTWQIPEVIEKSRQTSLERYRVPVTSQSQQAKNRQAETNMKKYGGKSPICDESVKLKSKTTCLEKYGVEHPLQNADMREKQQKRYHAVIIEKYGVYWPSQAEEIKKKIRYCKSGKIQYQEMSFDSAPELAYFIWLTDNSIAFEYQPKTSFQFECNGQQHMYFPDFRVNDQLIELKGDHFLKEDGTWQNPYDHSLDELYEAKRQCALANGVHIMYSSEYQKYLSYIDEKYGKDYLKKFKSSQKK